MDLPKKLQNIIMDLASFHNMDPVHIQRILEMAMLGEFDSIKQLGIEVDRKHIVESILEQTKLAQGDFLRNIDGLGNMGRIAQGTAALTSEQRQIVFEKYPICSVCGKHILIQTFKNSGVCNENCRKRQDNEPDQPGWHEIDVLRIPVCSRCGKSIELAEDDETWRHC